MRGRRHWQILQPQTESTLTLVVIQLPFQLRPDLLQTLGHTRLASALENIGPAEMSWLVQTFSPWDAVAPLPLEASPAGWILAAILHEA